MGSIEGRCGRPVIYAQEGFQKVWRSLCGVETLLESFPVLGACLTECWMIAGEKVVLGFRGFPTAPACWGGPEVVSMHVGANG